MKKLILFLVSIIMFTFTGCSNIIDDNLDLPITPTLSITFNNEDILVEKGGFQWTEKVGLFKSKSVIVDAASPDQIAEKMEGNKVTSSAQLHLKFSNEPADITVSDWSNTENDTFKLEDNKLVVPFEAGTYIYEIMAKWPEGHVSYTIKLIVSN